VKNIIVNTDSYKLQHWRMYPPKTEIVQSYLESRTGALFNKTVFFGLQYFIKEYLAGPVVTQEGIHEAKLLAAAHFGDGDAFNEAMWNHILVEHAGYLPIRIRAVSEGTPVDVSNVLMTVENTDPLCAPLTNHLETLLCNLWAPCTVASLSREVKLMCAHYLNETSDNPGHLNFQLHDFGQRGVSSPESAGLLGAGHLVNFMGTDTVLAMRVAKASYGAPHPVAFSVPASEHSVMTACGMDGEFQVFERLLDTFPKGILSVVIDSYDYRRFINVYARKLKDKILAREGKVVFRPDSGEPTSSTIDVLNLLEDVFGSSVNSKHYNTLNPKVGTLWGDGIDYAGIRGILFAMRNNQWASDNIVFGMGGGLLQKINRDTQRFAFKSCWQQQDGVGHDIFKRPLDTSKVSKKGRLKLIRVDGAFHTVRESERPELPNELKIVFENGELLRELSFEQVRANAAL
jgi:nicotinamide phosphoribosyltransferase